MSFLAELKRRNVPRALLAYAAAGWFLVEVADTAVPAFGLPPSLVGTLITILVVGVIPVAVLSWIYEWSPEGLKLDAEADRDSPRREQTHRSVDRAIIVVLLLALGLFVVDKFVLEPARDEQLAEQVRTETLIESFDEGSIAVLPFMNMSDDESNEYFSDGISEELLNLLAKVPNLRVISRTSSFQLKNTTLDIPEIAERLDVVYVLEGSVRKHLGRVRVTAQLIDSRTDAHLWSETYDRELNDVFAIQDEIATAIVGELKTALDIDEIPKLSSATTTVPEAHQAYLRGRFLIAKRTPEAVRASVAEFRSAVELDPDYPLAHAELSLALRRLAIIGDMSRGDAIELARPHAERAMKLDPTLAQAYAAAGYVAVSPESFDTALALFRRATELNPNYSDAHMWLGGFLPAKGEYAEAVEMTAIAARLDPLSRPALANHARMLIMRGRLADADRQLRQLQTIDEIYYNVSSLPIFRGSVNGAWADGILTLQGKSLPDEVLINGRLDAKHAVAEIFAILGLAEAALRLKDQSGELIYALLGRHDDAVQAVDTKLLGVQPARMVVLGTALAATGAYEDARPLLEKSLQLANGRVTDGFFGTHAAVALYVVRTAAGDDSGGEEIITAIHDNVSRHKEAKLTATSPQISVEFEEGIVKLLEGDVERGMALIEQAVDNGYFIIQNAEYLNFLYEQPGYEAIREKQMNRQREERQKVLDALCEPGAEGLFWELPEGTCP